MQPGFFLIICAFQLLGVVRSSTSWNGSSGLSGGAKPVIRIAYLFDSSNLFTPIKFMMSHFNRLSSDNDTHKLLLPDYDVVVDPYPFSRESGDSPVKVVEALLRNGGYHAIAGPWPKIDCSDTVRLTAAAKVMQVIKGDNTEFTDERANYPYVFRVLRNMNGIIHGWMYMLASNGWHSALGVWKETATLETAMSWAARYNISHYALIAPPPGDQWITDAWQSAAVGWVQTERLRVVLSYVYEIDVYGLVCRLYRLPITGLQHFVTGAYTPGWIFSSVFPPEAGDCTPDELYIGLWGVIGVIHTPAAPGINFLWTIQSPPYPFDQSQLPLSCMQDLTADSFYHSGEHILLAAQDGVPLESGPLTFYLGNAGSETDQVCVSLLALHDAIYNQGVNPDRIRDREPRAFETLIDSLSKVEMYGPTGFLRFYNNTGDPEILYYILTQYYVPGRSNYSAELTAYITYPNGQDGTPELRLINESKPLVWQDGSTNLGPKPDLALFRECGKENAELVWDSCSPCAVGRSYDTLLDACRTCSPGSFQNRTSSSFCYSAQPGFYVADLENPVDPSLCLPGHECPLAGTVSPQPCPPGRYAMRAGMAVCDLCPTGRFQSLSQATACELCDHGSTTANIASTSPEECICPAGAYRPAGQNSSKCEPCLEGMTCPEGSDWSYWQVDDRSGQWTATGTIPLAESGYMSLAADPLTVYKCLLEAHCPGGNPGSCAAHRDGGTVACGDCVEDAYENGDSCNVCGDSSLWPFIAAGFIGVIGVAAATLMVNRDMDTTPSASLMLVALAGLMFSSLQALGVFSQMAVPWVEPIKTVLELTKFLSFDLRILKAGCVMGNNPIRSFAARQSVAVLAIPFIAVTLLLKKHAPVIGRPGTRVLVELSNSVGTWYSVFFISIMISALNPFICYKHPGGNGFSVQSAPSLLCFKGGDHDAMMSIGVVALCLVPLPFLGLCVCGIYLYPRLIVSQDSSQFLHAMRFLFFRYSPKRYYFHLVLLGRSLGLCLIPAVLRGQPATQVLFMCIILCVYVIVEEELRPWRSLLCNPLDAIMSQMLVVMLLCGALFLEENPQISAVAALGSIVVVTLCIVVVAGVGIALWRLWVPHPFYHFFICHHKAHAAAQARFLKTIIMRESKVNVFIDSDNLQELDTLFDIVRSRVKHLVVYLTADTLRRPWCVGEIVTALRSRHHVTRLLHPSFETLTEEQLDNPDHYVDSTGCNLSEYGIQWQNVTDAFRHFLGSTIPVQPLSQTALGTRRFDAAAHRLLHKGRGGDDSTHDSPPLTEVENGGILIITYAGSDEASAAGGILRARIAAAVYRVCDHGLFLLADYKPDVDYAKKLVAKSAVVLVILTNGCMQSSAFLSMVLQATVLQGSDSPAPGIISVSTPGFDFPSGAVLDELCTGMPNLEAEFGVSPSASLKTFFKHISILLPTFASQHAIDTQCDEIFSRLHDMLKGKTTWTNFGPAGSAGGVINKMSSIRGKRSTSNRSLGRQQLPKVVAENPQLSISSASASTPTSESVVAEADPPDRVGELQTPMPLEPQAAFLPQTTPSKLAEHILIDDPFELMDV